MTAQIDRLLEWNQERLAKAEQALRCREQAGATWKDGSDATWRAASEMSGASFIPKEKRLQIAATEDRIAEKCRSEADMARRTLAALGSLKLAVAEFERLRDCDFVITPRDRMDAVRDIARNALTQSEKEIA